jgi:transposase
VKRHIVSLSPEERQQLETLTRTGEHSARKITRARVLLLADTNGEGWPDKQIAAALDVTEETVQRLRKKYLSVGLIATVEHQERQDKGQPKKIDGRVQAHIIALACGPVPDDKPRWTLSLLADRLVELEVVDGLSHESVRSVLKKTRLSLT